MASIDWQGSKPGHVQYGNLLMGPGTRYRWSKMEGWEDTPGIDSGTVPRASAHGSWPGVHLAQPRIVTMELMVKAEPGEVTRALRTLALTTPIDQPADGEVPLVVMADDVPYFVMARCTRRSFPVAMSNRVGLARGAIQWESSDPRKYDLVEQSDTISLPQDEDGIGFPLAFPLEWGGFNESGNITAVNQGDAPAHPMVAFRGPCTMPSVTNVNTGEILEYDISLAESDVLYVDTLKGTVTLNGPTTNRMYTVTTQSSPEQTFTLAPGSNSLAFRAGGGTTATMSVSWHSAYW